VNASYKTMVWKVVAAWSVVAVALVGCAPRGATPSTEEIVEIEEIEMKPPAAPPAAAAPVAEAGAEARKAVDEEKAAADRAIDAASKSITAPASTPAPASTSEPAVPSEPASPSEPAVPDAIREATAAANGKREKVMLGEPSLTAGVPGSGPITLDHIDAWLADTKNHAVLEPELPLGLSQGAGQIQGIADNPLTRAKIELGRQLYFDPRLSADSTVSCATCHHPETGYTAHTKTGVGMKAQAGNRNSPVSFNRILSGPQFWDGRAESLEAQAVGPVANPIEMGFTHEGVVERLAGTPVYTRQFEAIFGELTIDRVGQALASFERVIVTQPSPFDFYEQLLPFTRMDEDDIADDEELAAKYAEAKAAAEAHPMSESAIRGRDLFFGKANCSACHVGANLADEKYHNLGVGMAVDAPDLGRFAITKDEKDTGAFKTPTVRNVTLSPPYMHDGSLATLEEVVAWYDKGGHPNPSLSDKIKPLNLTEQERADLVEFMKACTSDTPPVETDRLPMAANP